MEMASKTMNETPAFTNREIHNAEDVDLDQTKPKLYPKGWRLHALTAGLCLSMLLSTLETTIVSTSLVSIVNDLQGFSQAGWVVTAYFLTYTGFLVIYAKLSDIFGTKLLILCAVTLFAVFSIACGVCNTMLQLIIFRAIQGIGGSGIYSLVTVMTPLMVPPAKYPTYVAIISSVFAISSVLGPLLGGAISDHTTWRWVFWLNGPGGALALVLLTISIPFSFPYPGPARFFSTLVSEKAWKRVDYLGAFASLAASILLVFALEQAGVEYPWKSAPIIVSFVLSGIFWIVFVVWERGLSLKNSVCEPMFPWSLACNRFVLGLLLNAFLTGFPFMSAIITIPQRFQVVNGTTAVDAGIRMLPLLLCSPIATILASLLLSKLRLAPLYVLLAGCSLQTLGVGLFSSLDSSDLNVPAFQYGYQVIMGCGFGLNLSTVLMMVPLVVKQRDMPVTMGAATQIRVLGGTIGLAICSALLSNHVASQISFLTPDQQAALLQSSQNIRRLPLELQVRIRQVYATGYNQQMRVMLYFCIASLVSLSFLVEWPPRRLQTTEDGEIAAPRK
ncbi:major facilitator superfamily transporter [Parachaetomium inaequale]|uniref:Major facilitator superfamily transporter n=1 Tax=Parachaetomium inaequale TaxID=2588326 RepID=A0AAN6P689_9PEZI|nr:major facilitator superfamily transporter [Parachaetomium inaequale]